MSKLIAMRLSEDLLNRIDAKGKNRSAVIVAAVEAYLGESQGDKPEQMIIERPVKPARVREVARPRERESAKVPESKSEDVWRRIFGDPPRVDIYQRPAHAQNCPCYSCKPR